MQLMLEAEAEGRGGLPGHRVKEREREAEFEKRLDGKAVRADMLGWDRHQQSYWWMQSTAPVLWVFGPEAEKMGFYHATEQLNALFVSLLDSGMRERGLVQVCSGFQATGALNLAVDNLRWSRRSGTRVMRIERERAFVQGLTSKFEALQESLASPTGAGELLQLAVSFEGGHAGVPSPRDSEEVVQQQQAASTAAAKAHLAALLQLCRECGLSVEECDRLRPAVAAATSESLIEVLSTSSCITQRGVSCCLLRSASNGPSSWSPLRQGGVRAGGKAGGEQGGALFRGPSEGG